MDKSKFKNGRVHFRNSGMTRVNIKSVVTIHDRSNNTNCNIQWYCVICNHATQGKRHTGAQSPMLLHFGLGPYHFGENTYMLNICFWQPGPLSKLFVFIPANTFFGSIVYNRAIVYTYRKFLKLVVHEIIIDQCNQTVR